MRSGGVAGGPIRHDREIPYQITDIRFWQNETNFYLN